MKLSLFVYIDSQSLIVYDRDLKSGDRFHVAATQKIPMTGYTNIAMGVYTVKKIVPTDYFLVLNDQVLVIDVIYLQKAI